MKNDYLIRKLYSSFVTVSILSALAATAGMLIDNIVVGRCLGTAELGAMGIIGPVSLVFSAFGNICSSGGAARAAQALGKGDGQQFNRVFTLSVLFALVSGVLLTAAGLLFTPQIAWLLGAREELLKPSVDYLSAYFMGAVPTLLTTALMSFVKIDGSPRLPLLCIVVMSVCNVVLDLLAALVFKMGMFGMALATSVSYVFSALTACTHFLKKSRTLRLVSPRGSDGELLSIISTGSPTALSRVFSTVQGTMLNNLLVAAVGTGAVTALNVRTTASNLFSAVIMGLSLSSMPILAMFYGEEDKNSIISTLKVSLRIGLVGNTAVAVLLWFIAPLFVTLLGVRTEALSVMAVQAVRIYALGMPLALINSLLISYYQSTRSPNMASLICLLEVLVFPVLLSFLLVERMSEIGVWLAFLLAEALSILFVVLRIAIKNRAFPRCISDFLCLEKGFGGNQVDRLELSIGNSMDEVMLISQGISKFGQSRQISEYTLNCLSLAIEEMAGNVVRHAFKAGEKKWFDLMVLDKPDCLIVRLRDNGAAFDPVMYTKEQGENPEALGIRLISALARDMEYRRTLGLNTLFITLDKK